MANQLQFNSTLEQLLNPTVDLGGGPGGEGQARALAQLALQNRGTASVGGEEIISPGRVTPTSTGAGKTLNNVLQTAQAMIDGISGKAPSGPQPAPIDPNVEQASLVGNPFGPGSFDPNNPEERQAIQAQGQQVDKVESARQFLISPELNRLPPAAQQSIVTGILQELGLTPDPSSAEFKKAFAQAKGKALGEGKGEDLVKITDASQSFRYDSETSSLIPAPLDITEAEFRKQGFRKLSPTILKNASEAREVEPALAALKRAVEGANQRSIVALKLSKETGGVGGDLFGFGEEGALLDTAQRDFAFQFDRLLGGVRAAASPTFFKAMLGRLPRIFQTPSLRTKSTQLLDVIVDGLQDEALRVIFGLPLDETRIQKAREAATAINQISGQAPDATTPGSLPSGITPGSVPTQRTFQGKPVFRNPNGELEVAE